MRRRTFVVSFITTILAPILARADTHNATVLRRLLLLGPSSSGGGPQPIPTYQVGAPGAGSITTVTDTVALPGMGSMCPPS